MLACRSGNNVILGITEQEHERMKSELFVISGEQLKSLDLGTAKILAFHIGKDHAALAAKFTKDLEPAQRNDGQVMAALAQALVEESKARGKDRMEKTTARVDEHACPHCGYVMDAVSRLPTKGDLSMAPVQPKPGDVSMCVQCTTYLSYERVDGKMEARELTDEEFLELHVDQRATLRIARETAKELHAKVGKPPEGIPAPFLPVVTPAAGSQ